MYEDDTTALMTIEDNPQALVPRAAALAQSEVQAQLDAAHRYPRSIRRFLTEAKTLATLTQDVASSCIYSLPRSGKQITGPSVRLAEMVASAYGNLQVGARIVDVDDAFITAQAVCWDVEKNLRATIEVRRRITDRYGKRYNDDMIGVTGNAACSIALRNAIFRVVPRAYVEAVYVEARRVAVGDATTLAAKRDKLMQRLGAIGITPDRVFARVGVLGVEDIGLEQMEVLVGLGTAIKEGDTSPDDAFPPVEQDDPISQAEEGRRIRLPSTRPSARPANGNGNDADRAVVEAAAARAAERKAADSGREPSVADDLDPEPVPDGADPRPDYPVPHHYPTGTRGRRTPKPDAHFVANLAGEGEPPEYVYYDRAPDAAIHKLRGLLRACADAGADAEAAAALKAEGLPVDERALSADHVAPVEAVLRRVLGEARAQGGDGRAEVDFR